MAGIKDSLILSEDFKNYSETIDAAIYALDPHLALKLLRNTEYIVNSLRETNTLVSVMRGIQKLECAVQLGTPSSIDISEALKLSNFELSDDILARISMIKLVVFLLQNDFASLRYFIEHDDFASKLVEGDGSPTAPISLTSRSPLNPLSSMLAVLLSIHEVQSRISSVSPALLLDELRTLETHHLGRLPKDSVLPSIVQRIMHETAGTSQILALQSQDARWALQSPTSHQMLLNSTLWAVRMEKSGNVAAAAAIWDRDISLGTLPIELQRQAVLSMLRCRFAKTLPADDLIHKLFDLGLIPTDSVSSDVTNSNESIVSCLSGLEPSESLILLIGAFSAAVIDQVGVSAKPAAAYRLIGAELAFEMGSGHLAESLVQDLVGQIIVSGRCLDANEQVRLSALFECLIRVRKTDAGLIDYFRSRQPDDELREESSMLHYANLLDDAVFITGVLPEHGPSANAILLETSFTGQRIRLLRALYAEKTNQVDADASYQTLKEILFSVPKEYLIGFWRYTKEFCTIAARHAEVTQVLNLMDTVVRGNYSTDVQELKVVATDLAEAYERVFEFRQAARGYDRLLNLGIFWTGDGTEIDGSTLYRSARCWAQNFSYEKVLPRITAALEGSQGISCANDRLKLLDLAATTYQHLGQLEKARNYLLQMQSLLRVNDLVSARYAWKTWYRAGLCAEDDGSLESALRDYGSASSMLSAYASKDDDDLILSKNREYFVARALGLPEVFDGTFENNKKTFDSPL